MTAWSEHSVQNNGGKRYFAFLMTGVRGLLSEDTILILMKAVIYLGKNKRTFLILCNM